MKYLASLILLFIPFQVFGAVLLDSNDASSSDASVIGTTDTGVREAEQGAQCFTPDADWDVSQIKTFIALQGVPSDELQVGITASSGDEPTGSFLVYDAVPAASLSGSRGEFDFDTVISLEMGTTYCVVFQRSGTLTGATNNYVVWNNSAPAVPNLPLYYFTGAWHDDETTLDFQFEILGELAGEGGGGSSTSTLLSVDAVAQTTFHGFILFFLAFWFMVWYFRGKAI